MNQIIYLAGEGWGNDSAFAGLCKGGFDVRRIEGTALPDLKGETVVFAGFKPIVSHNFIADNTCINIHYSLLPKYRGFHSTVWAILNDEDYLGLTAHLMSDYIDDGPIIHQFMVENDRVRTSREYMEFFNSYIADNIGQILEDYLYGKTGLSENNKQLATWVGKRTREDCKIDFHRDIHYLKNFFRALVDPYPLPYVEHKGVEYVVTKVGFHHQNVETHMGRILNIDNEGLWVKVLDGYILIKELRTRDGDIVPYTLFRIGQYLNQ